MPKLVAASAPYGEPRKPHQTTTTVIVYQASIVIVIHLAITTKISYVYLQRTYNVHK